MPSWTDQFVGDRMAVDRAFSERVAASEFSSQEWGTIMTAVELDIENPESPEEARVVAETDSVEQVMPALEQMRQQMGGAGGAPGGGGGGRGDGDASLFQALKRAVGLGDSERTRRAEAAAALAEEYARQFQDHLEKQGKWDRACDVAAQSDGERGLHGADDAPAEESDAATRDDGSGTARNDDSA